MIASEDWKGTRPDTKVPSEKAKFRVDYTPKVEFTVYILQFTVDTALLSIDISIAVSERTFNKREEDSPS